MDITSKKNLYISILLGLIFIFTLLVTLVFYRQSQLRHPVRPNRITYPYYRIVDQSTGKTLSNVSSVQVEKGDEFITIDNRRFIVVRIEKNQAFAKYAGKVPLTK